MRQPVENNAAGLLSRAIAVVEYVAGAGRPVAAAELMRRLGLPKPSAHRICGTLEEMGLLVRDPVARGMIVGPRLSHMALDTMLASADYGGRRRILRTVVEKVGATCTLTILDGDEALCLDRVESSSPLQVQLYAGSRVPLHCTASGKLFLALLPKSKRNRFIRAAPLKRYTGNTLTDPKELDLELDRIRRAKVSSDKEEFFSGLVAVAVPVHDNRQRACAAISVNAPAGRMSPEDAAHYVQVLREASASLTSFFAR